MGELRIEAKTLDDAITKACVELGITSDKLKYEVIEHGSKGFFGIGAKNCIIKVSSAAASENSESTEKKAEIKKQAVKSDDNKTAGASFGQNKQPAEKTDAIKDTNTAETKSENKASFGVENGSAKTNAEAERNESDNTDSDAAKQNEAGDAAPERNLRTQKNGRNGAGRRNDRSFDGRRSDRRGDRGQYSENKEPFKKEEREIKPVVLTEDPSERAKTFLESLFSSMEMKIDYSGEYNAEINELTVNLSGEDMGVLIGKRGQTLDALQYLTSQVVNKHQNGYIRVKLDTENYRERRKETLETFAVNMAHKVRKNKRPVVLEPMNAYERRIIHSVLQNEKDIITRSEGEEPYRHVVICPVRKRNNGYRRDTEE